MLAVPDGSETPGTSCTTSSSLVKPTFHNSSPDKNCTDCAASIRLSSRLPAVTTTSSIIALLTSSAIAGPAAAPAAKPQANASGAIFFILFLMTYSSPQKIKTGFSRTNSATRFLTCGSLARSSLIRLKARRYALLIFKAGVHAFPPKRRPSFLIVSGYYIQSSSARLCEVHFDHLHFLFTAFE